MALLIFLALITGFVWLIFHNSTNEGFKVLGLMASIVIAFVVVMVLIGALGIFISESGF